MLGEQSQYAIRTICMTAATAATATSSGNTPSRDVIFRDSVASDSMSKVLVVFPIFNKVFRAHGILVQNGTINS